ncbi:mucin-13 [Pogoniulus pusillus]|uniref:mucin-13 n=1 Tax=Pogoniulus pusillus TaxID=488313 RepID=UPI0030B92DAD
MDISLDTSMLSRQKTRAGQGSRRLACLSSHTKQWHRKWEHNCASGGFRWEEVSPRELCESQREGLVALHELAILPESLKRPGNNGTGNGNTTAPPEGSGNNGTGNGNTTAPPEGSGNNGTGNGNTTAPPEGSGNNGTGNGNTTAPPEGSGNNGTGNGNTTAPPEGSGNNGTGNGNTTAPPEGSGNNGTGNGNTTAPPEGSGNNGTGNGNTTAPPEGSGNNGTGNGNTTAPPEGSGNNGTGNGNTTAPPEGSGNNGTGNGNTTAPPEGSGNNGTGNGNTTAPPEGSGNNGTGNGNTTVPPEGSGDFCYGDPCGSKLAKCVSLATRFNCLCQYGFYYSNKDCHRGEVFPGVITVTRAYSDSVQIVNSTEYNNLFMLITNFFENAFRDFKTYQQTVILKIQLPEARAPSVSVTVTNLFRENSNVTNVTVQDAVDKAAENLSDIEDYKGASYCSAFNCDSQTTECKEMMFPECICKTNFTKTEWDDRSCSDCKDCSEVDKKYCVKEKGVPTCKCFPNFKKMEDGTCVACSVGFSGEECKNDSELILIIVGTVLGAIVLSLLIAISIVSVRAKHKEDPEKKTLINSEYSNPNTSGGRPTMMFPRVQTTSGHSNPGYQPNNPYETHSTKRGRFAERDYDDLEPEGFRMQNRY